MWRAVFLAVSLISFGDAALRPGERLEAVTSAELQIEEAGRYTLARSDGALVLGASRSENGWLVVDLQPGTHRVELPGEPGDLTLLAGAIEEVSSTDALNGAIASLNAGELDAARTSLLACRARPAHPAHHALARLFLGIVYQRQGVELSEARALLLSSREAAAAFGADIVALADDSLAQVSLELSEWDDATAAFTRIREAASDPSRRVMATSGLAQAAAGRHEHDRARELHEKALAVLDEEAGVAPESAFYVLFTAGKWCQSRAEFSRAAERLTRAADVAPTWYLELKAVGQLGLVELVRGHYGVALGLMDRAQELAAPHSPSAYDAPLLQNRAALSYALGEFGIAQHSIEQLSELDDDPATRATLLANRALIATMQDDLERAEQLCEQALTLAPEFSQARWLALTFKAALRFGGTAPKSAAPFAFEAMALAEELDDPYLTTMSLMGASEARIRLGEFEEARTLANTAVSQLEEQGAGDMILPALLGVARAALALGDEATTEKLLARAWEDTETKGVSALSSIEASQVRSRLSHFVDWGVVAADLAARRVTRDPAAAGPALAEVSRWKARAWPEVVANRQGLAGELPALLGDRTLVEYAFGEHRLFAFVSFGPSLRLVDLGPRAEIEEGVRTFLEGLTDESSLAGPAQIARTGGELYERLLAPLELSVSRVVLVPSGELARLPFEALVVSAPEEPRRFDEIEFVLDRMDVGYAPASNILAALSERPRPSDDGLVLLLGDPTYGQEARPSLLAARGQGARRWARLPQSRDELARVARLLLSESEDPRARDELFEFTRLEDARDLALSTSAFELRLGAEATVAELRRLAPNARLIHIASHAQVDRWNARRSGLVLAWDPEHQGLCDLGAIASLELDAELVILSACGTADGRLMNGEGVQSMAAAFLQAGALGVIATLWPVRDMQARDLMETFAAEHLGGGRPPDVALRLAKRALRRGSGSRGAGLGEVAAESRLRHPHYWSAFLYSGAGEPSRDR